MSANDSPTLDDGIRCPGCGRENAIPAGNLEAMTCTRCQCELGPLIVIRQAADDLVRRAVSSLRAGAHADALRFADDAWRLNHHPHAASCGLLGSLLLRDPDRIRIWSRRNSPTPPQ